MNNPLTGSAASWNEIIFGNKSQSEHCNYLPAKHPLRDVIYSVTAASETRTVCSIPPFLEWKQLSIMHIFQGVCMAAVGFACCEGLKGSSVVL